MHVGKTKKNSIFTCDDWDVMYEKTNMKGF